MPWRRRIRLIVFALLFTSRAGASENVLQNPELSEALLFSGWTIYFGTALDWTGQDSTGCPSSGSGQLESNDTDIGTQWAVVGQCVPIDHAVWTGPAYAAFSWFSFAAEWSYVQLDFYSDTACGLDSGNYIGFDVGPGQNNGPGWHRVSHSIPSIPALAQSMMVSIAAEAFQPTHMELLFDRAFFGMVPQIFADDFEVGSACRWVSGPP